MDANRFDHIAKLLARTPSRRGAVAALAGAAVAALLPSGRQAGAACGPNDECPKRETCRNGECVCYWSTDVRCDGRCVSLQSSFRNCGTCGHACKDGEQCNGGLCCPNGWINEGGACACPSWAPINCGGQCIDTQYDRRHCGSCGHACKDGEHCDGGLCCPAWSSNQGGTCVCYSDTTDCGGKCVEDLQTNNRHCGACGNRCRSDERCSYDEERGESRCCPKGKILCGGRCIVCDGWNRACVDGACGCAEGADICDGRCVNREWSQNHCGTCGNACRDRDHCSYGHCCPENHEWCERDGQCVFRICDGQDGHHAYDPENCLCDL